MTDAVTLRGYAVPFLKCRLLGDCATYEQFDRGAFHAFLGRNRRVELCFGGHERSAPAFGVCLELFADEYGLGFEAQVELTPHWARLREMTCRQAPLDQCSVGGLEVVRSRTDEHLGSPRTTILEARIDHIAITNRAVYGLDTGIWPVDRLDDPMAPWRLRQMAARWEAGRRAWDQGPLISRRAPKKVADRHRSLAAMLAPRQKTFAAFRRAVGSNPRPFNGVMLGHVAFSKAGGMDRR